MEYKDTVRALTKQALICEMASVFSKVLKAYADKEPIYSHIHKMKDILDILLERCK